MTFETLDVAKSRLGGRILVEASAGTGKTFALAALFLRLVLEERLTVERILVVTFTEAATEELRGRIRERLRGALEAFRTGVGQDDLLRTLLKTVEDWENATVRLTEALRCFDEAQIFTIHGFCQRVLQENAFECGSPFAADLLIDERPLLREVVGDFWRREMFAAPRALVAHARRRKITPESLAELAARRGRAPDLKILPALDEGPCDLADQECREAVDALSRLWPEARDGVKDLLLGHPALNRNRYRPGSIPGWVSEMDAYLDCRDPLAPFEKLEKFCQSTLTAAAKRDQSPPSHPVFEACELLHDRRERLQAELDRHLIALEGRLLRFVRDELPRRKAEENVRSFDDLLRAVQGALAGPGGGALARALRERYQAALIDEFQDTDPVQYAIFRTIFPDPDCRLFLIGDPKQAIYGFRGADVFAYLEAVAHADRHWTLGVNWRSTPPLVHAVNELFANVRDPFVFRQIPFHPVAAADQGKVALRVDGREDEAPFRIWFAGREGGTQPISKGTASEILPRAVSGEILRLLGAGAASSKATLGERQVEPGDVAVLVRTNRQAWDVKSALEEVEIPAVVYGSETLFGAREPEEILRVLSAVLDPRSERRVRAALVTDLLGHSGNALERLSTDDGEWDRCVQRFAGYRELWAERGFAVMARALLAEEGVRARLLPLPDGERRLTNVLHCLEVLQAATTQEKLGPEGLIQWLGRRIEERADAEEYQLRLETDERAVKVVTVHKSKGLQYPIVFCPFAWGGSREKDGPVLFHDPEDPLRVVLDLGSEDLPSHRARAERENLAENLRLLYVALTRAQARCHLVWGGFRDAETSALAYLLHPPTEAPPEDDLPWVDPLAARVAALSDAEMRLPLDVLAQKARGVIAVEDLPEGPPPGARYAPPAHRSPDLTCRPFTGRLSSEWGVSSFSSLSSGVDDSGEFPDRDPWVSSASPGETPGAAGAFDFLAFPRGTRAGTCLHAMLEGLDYTGDRGGVEAVVREGLRAHGFDAAWGAPVTDALCRALSAPLDPGSAPLSLCQIGRGDRVNEMEFYLPTGLLTPGALARVFSAHGGPPVPEALTDALGALDFRPTRGFLKGFIDLVFCAGSRYYLVDWKSNYLGSRAGDYTPESLQRAMDAHLYGLQYHLYTAALHRHLAARLPGYDYDLHFGGVFYLFLRGVDPSKPGRGIYRARPPRELVAALCRYLSGEGE